MAAKQTFSLIVTKVDGPLFSGTAEAVSVPGQEGDMTILAHHEPLISPLRGGTIVITVEGVSTRHEISSGMMEVSNNQVTILV